MSDPLIQQVLKLFEDQARRRLPPSLAVLGPPGSGKSIFLDQLINTIGKDEASCNYHCLKLDLRSIPVGSQIELYIHTNQALLQEAARIGIPHDFDIKVQIPHLRFEEILRQLLTKVEGHLVIFIDHLESVPRFFAGDLSHRFRNFLETTDSAELIPERESAYRKLGLVVAGAVSLFDLKHGPNSAFQMLHVIPFPRVDRAMRVLLVEDYLKNYMSTEISPDLIQLLADLTGGEPGFLEPLMVHLLKRGQISLDEALLLSAVEELCSYSQIPALRNLALHLWGDKGLRDIVRDLKQLPSVMPRFAIPDIDRYQLSGAVVVGHGPHDKSREYQFRNGITEQFLTRLYHLLKTREDEPKSQISIPEELEKLETAKSNCLNAPRIWMWLKYLRDGWELITRYSVPNIFLYVTKPRANYGWWLDADAEGISGPELRVAANTSTESAAFIALENIAIALGGDLGITKAFVKSDDDRISIALPLCAREISIILVATLSRTDAGRGFTEFDLCHWIQFVQNVKHVVQTLALAEFGQKMIEDSSLVKSTSVTQSAPLGGTRKSPAKYIYLLPAVSEKIANDLNNRCLRLVDQWTDSKRFDEEVAGIALQLATAMGEKFSALTNNLVLNSDIQETIIATDAEGLKIPFELFPHERTHLSVLTGLSRQIIGYRLPTEVSFSFDHLLTSLAKANPKDKLSVLLVASDVDGNLPHAAEELQQVREHVEAGCRLIDLKPRFVIVPPEEASVKKVEAELKRNGPFQLFHYTGHARHPSEDPAASGIVLLGENNEPEVVTCKRLSRWLKGRGLWLVYLSSCHSGAASGSSLGLSQRYVGTMEAVVEAGVPNVVGFRCMVSDKGAFHLASEFYRQLFEVQTEKNPSLAMLEARHSVQGLPDFFDAWASAMLITQYS